MIADYRKNGSNSKYASKLIAMAEVQRKYEEMIKIRKQIPFIKRIFHKSVSKMVSDFYKKNND
jgi:hypothetical protein